MKTGLLRTASKATALEREWRGGQGQLYNMTRTTHAGYRPLLFASRRRDRAGMFHHREVGVMGRRRRRGTGLSFSFAAIRRCWMHSQSSRAAHLSLFEEGNTQYYLLFQWRHLFAISDLQMTEPALDSCITRWQILCPAAAASSFNLYNFRCLFFFPLLSRSLAERAVVAAAEMSLSILFLSDEILSRISSRRPATGTRRLDALIHPDAKMLDALRSDVWPRRRRHTKIINELRFISGRPAGTYAVTR